MTSRHAPRRPLMREADFTTYEAQPQSPLLSLPAELRTSIFEAAFTSPTGTITIDLSPRKSTPFPHSSSVEVLSEYIAFTALTRTCKQIFHETQNVLPRLNVLRFYLPLWPESGSVAKLDSVTVGRWRRVLWERHICSDRSHDPAGMSRSRWKGIEVDLGRLPILRFEPAFRGWYNGEQALGRLRVMFPGLTLRLEVWNAETERATELRMGMNSAEDIQRSLEDARESGGLQTRDYACLKDLMELERIMRVVVGTRE